MSVAASVTEDTTSPTADTASPAAGSQSKTGSMRGTQPSPREPRATEGPPCTLALAATLVVNPLGSARAASVGTLPYRGELAEGGSKVTGKRALRFTVKTHPTSGQVVFEQTVANVELNVGRFAVELGACNRADTTCTGEGGAAAPALLKPKLRSTRAGGEGSQGSLF